MALRRIDVHRAVERGDVAVLTRYLDAGGDPEKKDTDYGAAPLHWASLVRRYCVNCLLSFFFLGGVLSRLLWVGARQSTFVHGLITLTSTGELARYLIIFQRFH